MGIQLLFVVKDIVSVHQPTKAFTLQSIYRAFIELLKKNWPESCAIQSKHTHLSFISKLDKISQFIQKFHRRLIWPPAKNLIIRVHKEANTHRPSKYSRMQIYNYLKRDSYYYVFRLIIHIHMQQYSRVEHARESELIWIFTIHSIWGLAYKFNVLYFIAQTKCF